jgi:hypothetical protein
VDTAGELLGANVVEFKKVRLGVGDIGLRARREGMVRTEQAILGALFGPRNELGLGGVQVQVGVKESVVGDVPEFVFVGVSEPQRFGAVANGLQEHRQRRPVLLHEHVWKIRFRQGCVPPFFRHMEIIG